MAIGAGAIIGGSMGLAQGIFGAIQAGKAKKALNAFDRQELNNVYENLSISTVGSEMILEENARTASMGIDAARSGGVRGIMNALPKIQAQTNSANLEARKYLDDQIIDREYAIARDNQRIQAMQEQRDNADLAGIGQQLFTGQQNMWSGFRSVANAGMSAMSPIETPTLKDNGF